MKVLLAVFLTSLIGVVFADYCNRNNVSQACGHVTCPDPTTSIACDGYLCTCVKNSCGDVSPDCNDFWNVHACRDSFKHCIDNKCLCKNLHD